MSNYTVGLFVGIESFSWTFTDFNNLVGFCKKHGINQIVLKVYEITQGDWYQNLGGSFAVVKHIKDQGMDVLPYGYLYGNNINIEAAATKGYLAAHGKFCANMEAKWNNQSSRMQEFANALASHTGDLYISTWADPETQGWLENIKILEPVTHAFMPEAYNDFLVKLFYSQFPKTRVQILPTFHVTNTSPKMAGPFTNFTLWEYQDALNNERAVQAFMAEVQTNPATDFKLQQAHDIWNMNTVGANITSPFGTMFLAAYKANINLGYVTSHDTSSVNWDGQPITIAYFSSGNRAELNKADTVVRVYSPTGSLVFSK